MAVEDWVLRVEELEEVERLDRHRVVAEELAVIELLLVMPCLQVVKQ